MISWRYTSFYKNKYQTFYLLYFFKVIKPAYILVFQQYTLLKYGGPDGELGASMRYISQRYSMPYREVSGLLTDIGTEELGHFEMISTMVHQLTRNLSMEQIKGTPFEAYYVDHTAAVWPQAAGGIPFNACEFQSKGDAITDITEDMAADGTTAYVQHRSVK